MRPMVGWWLGGPTFSARDLDDRARLGEPLWGPSELMRDLQLRLGIPEVAAPMSERLPQWVNRIRAVGDPRAFYARSFAVDSLGTASTLLAWRDDLVAAGWDGAAIANGGDRLAAIAAIEARREIDVLPGIADRLIALEAELASSPQILYESLALADGRALWSQRWERVFRALEARGTRVVDAKPETVTAPPQTDLGLLQRLLRGEPKPKGAATVDALRGDGTLLVLRGETPAEVAALTAGLLARNPKDVVVVRSIESASLDAALVRQGLPAQGHVGSSGSRPAMQILPLALELAYEPRDPYRLLELLTLPVGPFSGFVGRSLARAVSKQPGIGGQEWTRQRTELATRLQEFELTRQIHEGVAADLAEAAAKRHAEAKLAQVAEWIEARGAGPEGATRAALLDLATRVRTWLQNRMARDEDRPVYAAAYAQAQAFSVALANDARERLTHEDARHLLETLVRAEGRHQLAVERAGRIAHVAHPSAILASTGTVVFWGLVNSMAGKPSLLPWNRAERAALQAAGLVFSDPGMHLQAEAEAWRRGVLAARERVILVIPSTIKGEAMSPHPVWDEIAARLELDEAATRRLTRHARAVLDNGDESLADLTDLPPLALPDARAMWKVSPELLAARESTARALNATTLEQLASCPLAWVLERRADLRAGAVAKVSEGPILNGSLSHRLVEELHREGAFALAEKAFAARVEVLLDGLIEREGATLLLPGAVFERSQLRKQIAKAMRTLRRYLDDAGFTIAAVEEPLHIDSSIGPLAGRLDVRLANDKGESAVLDLKWGASSYRLRLQQGRAVQLAVYARALHGEGKPKEAFPAAAYFAIGAAKVLTTDARMKSEHVLQGPTIHATWRGVERTATAVMKKLARGEVYVARQKEKLPLLSALGVPESQHDTCYQAADEAPCAYCACGPLCGRSWEGLR